ncbi:receptor type Q [Nothobranchius furzeri]|uniref:Receptor type Q n=5 Tax=Nothobranchius TaxID=28779 RepID=A0A9D2YPR8_NOTFU|nr:receptor type Q [Nothobranchius furzeri]
MTRTEHLWFLCSLFQVVLSCEQRLHPVEVEMVFESFPSGQDPDSFTITCRSAGNPLTHMKHFNHSACSPDCRILLQLTEDRRGYSIMMRASRKDSVLETKTFHFIPVSLSSFHIFSTTTTAQLKWKLNGQRRISTLTLYDMRTQSVTRVFDINSPEIKSHYTMNGLPPGTSFKAEVAVASLLAPGITLKQKLSIVLETDQCPHRWLADERSCYTVRRSGLSWSDAQLSCTNLAAGSHLANLKTPNEQLFVSSHLLTDDGLLLLWTGLNDQQDEGHALWSDASPYNQTNSMVTLLPAGHTDCFAFQRNATGPGYFLTPFFCDIPLPFICQYQTPSTPASFSFDLVQVTEQQVELRWSDLTPSHSLNLSSFEIFLQYHRSANGLSGDFQRDGCWESEKKKGTKMVLRKTVTVLISLSSRGVTLAGLSPGSIYFFTLQVSHPAGPSWTLGQTQTAYMRPLPPQNITVGRVTANQISIFWMLPGLQCENGWTFVVNCEDISSKKGGVISNISRIPGTDRKQFYTAVMGGLEPYRKYRVEVFTVTQFGIWSCRQVPLIVQTAVKPPSDLLVFSLTANLSVCWTSEPDDPPDGYHITSRSLSNPTVSSLWINDSSFDELWRNKSVCVNLGAFIPGHTYEISVVALKGSSRSEGSSITHTTAPLPVLVAVPLSVGTNYAHLFLQPPRMGLIDGVKVCACPGVCSSACMGSCGYLCVWHSFPTGDVITIRHLSPGFEYQLSVSSTSGGQAGPLYYTHPIRTGLAPPSRVREGLVTESSIELIWDPAEGQADRYEIICLNCNDTLKIQKAFITGAVFSGLTPGSLYHFAVRTEKESFADSLPVSINITAAPSPAKVSVVNKTTSSICISWTASRGVVSTLILSIKATTSIQELTVTHQELRSYSFEGLDPGSRYTIEVITTSGERRSKPATLTIYTVPGVPQEVALSEHPVMSAFVTWRPPAGQVDKYKLLFGLLSMDRKWWTEVFVESTGYEIRELIPGSDYGVSVQSVLGSDTSQAVNRDLNTHPAGLCSLHLDGVNSSSVTVSWNSAPGEFDHHRVTVTNASVTKTLTVPKEECAVVVTGLLDGCSYNVSTERVRGVRTGSAAFLTVTTVPKQVRGLTLVNVSEHGFSVRWLQAEGCVDRYQVSLLPNQGKVIIHSGQDGYVQADASSVSPGTQYTLTVTTASSSNISPGVSRMISTSQSAPGAPEKLVGEPIGSNGILLTWASPSGATNVIGYVYRYKEVCPYPDALITQETTEAEHLLTELTSGSTYQIQVAAKTPGKLGAFSKPIYVKTAESPPGLVTNLTAYAQNHTLVVVTWFLPHRINGLITKFAVKVKYVRTGMTARVLEVNAEEIMNGALPHCNDAADILSRATPSPLDITASSPSITLSAVPPAASWSVPISVGVDQLLPYTAYLFEVSAFTSAGQGQTASTMVRMPESAPEDSPQNLLILNVTSRWISVSWSSPNIITGKFTYVLYISGPTGFLYENSTSDVRFSFTGLTPFTKYKLAVRAKAAGEVGPAAERNETTLAEAPSAVQNLVAKAEDSVSIRVSWKSPAQPNGPITQYRLQVLVNETLMQDITLTSQKTTGSTLPVQATFKRRKRSLDLTITSPPIFTPTVSAHTVPTEMTAFNFTPFESRGTDLLANTKQTLSTNKSSTGYESQSRSITQSFGTFASSVTSMSPTTPPPWLMKQPQTEAVTSNNTSLSLTPGQLRLSTRDASVITYVSPRSAAVSGATVTAGVTVKQEVVNVLSGQLSYLVSDLNPFTEYTFKVTASTTAGEGPAANITEKTSEQVPSSVFNVTYQNISSTSIFVSWRPPLNPNGMITHYTIYSVNLRTKEAIKFDTNTTSMMITDLDKYTAYKLRVAASTAVGESSLSEEDDVFVYTLEDEPDSPPENLSVLETSSSTATLTWSAPGKANGVIQYYEVLYENESFSTVMNVTSNKATLMNLKPFSYYNVSVKAFTRYGDGNQTSDTLYLLSGEDVPGSPPYGLSYESVSPSEVNVTWHPPLLPNGVITYYSLELWNSSQSLNLSTPTNFIRITHLRKYAQYRLTVQAHTRAGPGNYSSEPLNITTREDVPSDPVSNLTAQNFSSTAIIVSWDPPTEPNGRPYYILTLQEAGMSPDMLSPGTPAVNKTIKQATTDNVFLFTKLRKYFPYVLTVTPATGAGPAYNQTSTMYLRTDDDVPSSAPLMVSAINVSSSSIAVDWQRPLESNGEITEYTLTLSGPEGSSTTQTPNTSAILTQLFPYTAYNLSIIAATRKGAGPTLLVQLHTDEGGPTSPPRNLTIYNHTAVSVWLSWEPPLEPNGVVIKYGFWIQDLITETVTHQNSSGPSTTEHLSGFRPHSSYEISVCSYTRVGHGNQFSSPVTFTTNESVSDAVGNLSCSGVSWDSIELSWEVPANPNGQILFYEMIEEVDLQTVIHQIHTPGYTLTGLLPNQEYAFIIAAVNSAGPGARENCTVSTLPESVPAAPRFLTISQITSSNLTLKWAPPLSVPGLLRGYDIVAELLSDICKPNTHSTAKPTSEDNLSSQCVEHSFSVSVNASDRAKESSVTLQSLAKYRNYRFKVAAVTNAGVGEYTLWNYAKTLAGNPDAPPRNLNMTPTATSFRITWEAPAVLSGPTSYLVQVDGPGVNFSVVRAPGELMTVVVTNLTAFTSYAVTVTAFTGTREQASSDGKAVGPLVFRTLEEQPKDPPNNVTVSAASDTVNSVMVSFGPPQEPNGNITAYFVFVYENDQLVKNISLENKGDSNTVIAVVDGLKGGRTYSIQVAARNGVGNSPLSSHVQITTGIKAPSKPTDRPQAMLNHRGVSMVTHSTITIKKPICFYSDDNGPIAKIQVIVAELGVRDDEIVTNWSYACLHRPTPYFTDEGFPNPKCLHETAQANVLVRGGRSVSGDIPSLVRLNQSTDDTYVIGANTNCRENDSTSLCNGPLKSNTVYVFKFRATNIQGQYTDSDYSEHIRTAVNGLLTKEEQIILGVLVSFFLALFLIVFICCSVKLHQRKKEGGTYSPREAEIIETKCKLDQLIAVADMELKQEKLNRYSSFFFRRKEIYVIHFFSPTNFSRPVNKKSFLQHVEDLCARDNIKFQEEFVELPKLLPDLATTDADLPWNKSKNRFLNIKPYNNNRVKLLSEPGVAGSDYINASFVSGYLCPNEFIATQGPLSSTVADFWRMIWETGTRTIAMLTQCYEKDRIRCHKYWPEDNKPVTVFSDFLISKVSEEVLPDWTIRTLKIEKHGHYILVKHFNFTSWPEHGVPESCSTLIKFVKTVRAHRHDNSTIVVHCSAGVGRTGVFIALDHLIQHIRDHDFVDIYGLVAELRSERMCMVQNLAQYIFLHQCTLELLNNKGNSQSIWFVNYSALEKMDSLDAMEGDVELEWEETTM